MCSDINSSICITYIWNISLLYYLQREYNWNYSAVIHFVCHASEWSTIKKCKSGTSLNYRIAIPSTAVGMKVLNLNAALICLELCAHFCENIFCVIYFINFFHFIIFYYILFVVHINRVISSADIQTGKSIQLCSVLETLDKYRMV